jgi:hypothetical protein
MDNKFFGSKLNSVLLLILIILMVIAIYIMLQNKEVYLDAYNKEILNSKTEQTQSPKTKDLNQQILGSNWRILPGYNGDLVSFSVMNMQKVSGILSYRGVIKGGYFFEGNILINILDSNKKVLKQSNAIATTEWTTSGPVSFEGNIDFTGLPKGLAYFEIHNDNASGLPQNDKSILIPIVIE